MKLIFSLVIVSISINVNVCLSINKINKTKRLLQSVVYLTTKHWKTAAKNVTNQSINVYQL